MGLLQVFLIIASSISAPSAPVADRDVPAEAIAIAIRQLGAHDFEVRQRATDYLWQAGRVAEPALRRAAESADAEVRLRASSILEDLQYGVFADTPDDIATLVRRYRREEGKNRELLWTQILQRAAIETLVAVSANEPLAARRHQVLKRLEGEGDIELAVKLAEQWRAEYDTTADRALLNRFVRSQVPYFLEKQRYEKSESILEQSATDDAGIRDWAVYLFLRGQLDEKIEELERQLQQGADDPEDRIVVQTRLLHMLRVKGDEERALAIARQLESTNSDLLQGLLFDQRAWSELALRQRNRLDADPDRIIEHLGFAAAYERLAGNTDSFIKHIITIREYAEKRFGGNNIEYCREALFLNGFTDEAIQLLSREDAVEAFQVQIIRGQYVDAFESVGIGTTRESRDAWLRTVLEHPDRSRNWQDRFRIAVQLAALLATTGEKHESVERFGQLANVIKASNDAGQLRELAESELRVKMVEEAFEHAAQAFDKDRNAASITLLFKNRPTTARTWWDIYSALEPTETTRQRLARLRKLFYQQQDHSEVIDEISRVDKRVEALDSKHNSRSKWLHSIGETYLLHKADGKARDRFQSIAEDYGPAAVRLADMLAKEERWVEACRWYREAWQQDRQPYALYLVGEMLTKSGQSEMGEQSKQLARLIPLAGGARYDGLASHLAQRGLTAAANLECELLRRCSTWSDEQMFKAVASLIQAVDAEDPLQAAAYSEQRMLNCLQQKWHFTEQGSYIRIPHEVHQTRAKGLMNQHQVEQAIAELRLCQKIWPAELNLPEVFVPRLDQVGESEVADELFSRAYALVDETCDLFPNSALHHNNAAWLAARCHRRLDDALAHITRALELVPKEAQYIDTLGEVYFQRGQFDLAIDCAKQCVQLEPSSTFYQEQLSRFEAAREQPE